MTEYVMEYDGWAEGIPAGEYLKVRNAMHARKREEIVRCRDCESFIKGAICGNGFIDGNPDAFCSWGERRDV